MTFGTLYLIPVPLADDAPNVAFDPKTQQILRGLRHFIVEDAKSARAVLKSMGFIVQELQIYTWNEHSRGSTPTVLLDPLLAGHGVGLLSECGVPAVADPGESIVYAAHMRGIPVCPLPGPSSILLALMGAGLSGERFRFYGYVPQKEPERGKTIRQLSTQAGAETQIMIETPYRSDLLFSDLLREADATLALTVAMRLTAPNQAIETRTIAAWKGRRFSIGKNPAVFLLGRPPVSGDI